MNRRILLLTLLITALAGCATTGPDGAPYDPAEPVNRKIYAFNTTLDKAILGPVARGYRKITPQPVRTGVTNFFDNASYMGTALNNFAQGKINEGVTDTTRFLINGTVGILGIFDVASLMEIPKHNEDIGQTLGWYGATHGAYLELPVLGPSNARDVVNVPTGFVFDWTTYALSSTTLGWLTVLKAINTRANLDQAIRMRDQAALDPYNFQRSSYLQYRENLVRDGQPDPNAEEDDPFEDLFKEIEEEEAAQEQ